MSVTIAITWTITKQERGNTRFPFYSSPCLLALFILSLTFYLLYTFLCIFFVLDGKNCVTITFNFGLVFVIFCFIILNRFQFVSLSETNCKLCDFKLCSNHIDLQLHWELISHVQLLLETVSINFVEVSLNIFIKI